jgi:uncharacterized membrane protein
VSIRFQKETEDVMLLLHVATGIGALALGAVLLWMDKRSVWHPRLGGAYQWVMLIVAVSALAVSALRGRATVFTYLAPPSYGLALLGYVSARARWRNWLSWHITGQTGSYVALITATLFQIVPRFWQSPVRILGLSVVFWAVLLAPALVASPFIGRTRRRWVKKNDPRASSVSAAPDDPIVNAA